MKKVIFIIFLMTSSFSYSSPCESAMKIGAFARFHLQWKEFSALKDKDVNKRLEAVRLLAQIRKPSLLKKALKNEYVAVRSTAVYLLGEMGEPALPLLEKALEDKFLYVRGDVVRALKKIGEPALPLLEKALEDEDMLIRLNTIRVLVEMGKPAQSVLERAALRSRDSDVRSIAVEGLKRIKNQTDHLSEQLM